MSTALRKSLWRNIYGVSIIIGLLLGAIFLGVVAGFFVAASVFCLVGAGFWYKAAAEARDISFGSAAFATKKDMKSYGLFLPQGVLLGRFDRRQLYYQHPGHLLTAAPTGAGKGVSVIIPNLLTYPHSVVVTDIKGENAHITLDARCGMGQQSCVVDPFHITSFQTGAINPLWQIDQEDIDGEANRIVELLMIKDAHKQDHWEESAHQMMVAVIYYVMKILPKAKQHLGEVRRLLTLPPKRFDLLIGDMLTSIHSDALLCMKAQTLKQKSSKEREYILSTCHRHTAFLDNLGIQEALQETSIDLEKLSQGTLSVYLVLPPDKVSSYSRFLRLMIGELLKQQLKTGKATTPRTLFLLDEFPALGYMPQLEDALAYIRGYGVTMWYIVQDMAQLKETYPKWQSMLANMNVVMSFKTQDAIGLQYISDQLGKTTVDIHNIRRNADGTKDSYTVNPSQRSLLYPDEIRTLDVNDVLLFVDNLKPIKAKKINYLNDSMLKERAKTNPLYA